MEKTLKNLLKDSMGVESKKEEEKAPLSSSFWEKDDKMMTISFLDLFLWFRGV